MIEQTCLHVKELAEVLACGPDDRRSLHLARCPRCQTLAAEYEGFMAAGGNSAGLSAEEMTSLDQALVAALDGPGDRGNQPVQGPGTVHELSREGEQSRRLPRWLVAVPAVAAVLAFFIASSGDRPLPADPAMMRGEVQPDTLLVLHPVGVGEDGQVSFSWVPSSQADSYSVELLAGDLGRLTRLPAVAGSSVEVSPNTLALPEPTRFWRVIGFQAGDPVIRSGLREFPQ